VTTYPTARPPAHPSSSRVTRIFVTSLKIFSSKNTETKMFKSNFEKLLGTLQTFTIYFIARRRVHVLLVHLQTESPAICCWNRTGRQLWKYVIRYVKKTFSKFLRTCFIPLPVSVHSFRSISTITDSSSDNP